MLGYKMTGFPSRRRTYRKEYLETWYSVLGATRTRQDAYSNRLTLREAQFVSVAESEGGSEGKCNGRQRDASNEMV